MSFDDFGRTQQAAQWSTTRGVSNRMILEAELVGATMDIGIHILERVTNVTKHRQALTD
jgi:hypothetical protein